MPIHIKCPNCGKRLLAPDSSVGKMAKCGQCLAPLKIETPKIELSSDDFELPEEPPLPTPPPMLGQPSQATQSKVPVSITTLPHPPQLSPPPDRKAEPFRPSDTMPTGPSVASDMGTTAEDDALPVEIPERDYAAQTEVAEETTKKASPEAPSTKGRTQTTLRSKGQSAGPQEASGRRRGVSPPKKPVGTGVVVIIVALLGLGALYHFSGKGLPGSSWFGGSKYESMSLDELAMYIDTNLIVGQGVSEQHWWRIVLTNIMQRQTAVALMQMEAAKLVEHTSGECQKAMSALHVKLGGKAEPRQSIR